VDLSCAGDVAEISDATLLNVALYPANSSRAFVPVLLDLRGSGSRVVVRNSTLWTTCGSLQQHADFLQGVAPAATVGTLGVSPLALESCRIVQLPCPMCTGLPVGTEFWNNP
jgi:hypothetical protein